MNEQKLILGDMGHCKRLFQEMSSRNKRLSLAFVSDEYTAPEIIINKSFNYSNKVDIWYNKILKGKINGKWNKIKI